MKTSDFDYALPEELIAQTPAQPRDASRMMVCNCGNPLRAHHIFRDLPAFLRPGDALVINETRVIPARLLGVKSGGGAAVEVLLLKRLDATHWETLVRPGKKLRHGAQISFGDGRLRASILDTTPAGGRMVAFAYEGVFETILDQLGEMPLPPYITARLEDKNRYQTVYAKYDGSAAAPTAGLHFTPAVLDAVRARGVHIVPVLLHVGLGTFRPVKETEVEKHIMHSEAYSVSQEAAQQLNAVRASAGRIVSVGTTSLRTLETVADSQGHFCAQSGDTDIFITPGYRFRGADMLLTNFHLPQSTLLMLVSAFMGRENALSAYAEAVAQRYRFFSFGDCMLIGPGLVAPC